MQTSSRLSGRISFLLLITAGFAQADPALQIKPLRISAALDSAQPSVVADAKRGEFVLSWQQKHTDACHSLELAIVSFQGARTTVGKAKTAARGCDWFVNWADFPSVAIADNGDWVTHFLQRHRAGKYAYNIMVTRSEDRGEHWQPPFRLHDDDSPTEHGFVALAPAGGEQVLAAWLDGRTMHIDTAAADNKGSGHDAHAHHSDRMSLRSALIQRAGKITSAQEIDANVCSCCNNDLVRTGSAHQLVFRNRSVEETRDIGTAFWRDGRWQSQGIVHDDGWKIAGCPVNGPAVASAFPGAAASAQNLVVWTTMSGDRLEVRAKLRGEKLASAMVTLDAGENVLGRVDAAAWGDSQWLVSWLGSAPSGQSALNVAVLDQRLRVLEKHTIATLAAGRNIGMPRLASLKGHRALLVWTDAMPRGKDVQTELRAVLLGHSASTQVVGQ